MEQQSSKLRAVLLIPLLALAAIACCFLIAWIFYSTQPDLCVMLLPVALIIAAAFWRLRRIEKKEIARFKTFPPTPDKEFLKALQIAPTSPESKIALAARAAFADLGCVPPESIKASNRFFPDLQKLPFYDSIDQLHMIFTLERELKMKIPKQDADLIFKYAPDPGSITVGQAVLGLVDLWKRQQQQKQNP